jgi:CheY-like chemotaxis protein
MVVYRPEDAAHTGLDVLEWMQENPVCRVVPTIMLSNSDIDGDINHAYELGVNAFFTKPRCLTEMEEIFVAIDRFWGLAKLPTIPAAAKCP